MRYDETDVPWRAKNNIKLNFLNSGMDNLRNGRMKNWKISKKASKKLQILRQRQNASVVSLNYINLNPNE
jgi:hypothetical protein